MLAGSTEATATALVAVHPTTELGIQRRVYTPPPPPPPPPPTSPTAKLRSALQDDIAAQRITVGEAGNQIMLRLASAMFAPGDATVKPEFRALLERLGKLLRTQTGAIKVIGHTDSAPIKNVRFRRTSTCPWSGLRPSGRSWAPPWASPTGSPPRGRARTCRLPPTTRRRDARETGASRSSSPVAAEPLPSSADEPNRCAFPIRPA